MEIIHSFLYISLVIYLTKAATVYISPKGLGYRETLFKSSFDLDAKKQFLVQGTSPDLDCSAACSRTDGCIGFEVELLDNEKRCKLRSFVLLHPRRYQPAEGVTVFRKDAPRRTFLGCYPQSVVREILMSMRDSTGNGVNILGGHWDEAGYAEILDLCALMTQARGYSVFGLVYYGECWSDPFLENAIKNTAIVNESNCPSGLGVAGFAGVHKIEPKVI